MRLKAASLTDIGLQREVNEDYFAVDNATGLYIVADGMGGHLAGEIASKVAVQITQKNINNWIARNSTDDELFGYPDNTLCRRGNYILSSIRLANRVIYEMSTEYEEYKGMGTTIGILAIMPSTVISANVGDSMIYLIRGDKIEPLSREHNMVAEQLEMGLISEEEAQSSPLKHVLTRNLGSSDTVDVEIFEIEPKNDDRFLLCTDGLTDLLTNNEILAIIKNGDDPEDICQQLISEANVRGGHDNTTVSLVIVEKLEKEKKGILKRFSRFYNKE